MKLMKLAIVLFSIATAVVLYMNKDFVRGLVMGEKAKSKKEVSVRPQHYKLDANIANKAEYFVDARLQSMYTELSNRLIERDIEIRKRLMFVQDKSAQEIDAYIQTLTPVYEKERTKIKEYCSHGSAQCDVEIMLTGDSVVGSDIKMNISYNLDSESMAFFNEVHYVDNKADKWYEAQLISMNEKRFYPKSGKFQEREQHTILKEDSAAKVDISQILEGNANEWNVKF